MLGKLGWGSKFRAVMLSGRMAGRLRRDTIEFPAWNCATYTYSFN
jgi:hypothetical protein